MVYPHLQNREKCSKSHSLFLTLNGIFECFPPDECLLAHQLWHVSYFIVLHKVQTVDPSVQCPHVDCSPYHWSGILLLVMMIFLLVNSTKVGILFMGTLCG